MTTLTRAALGGVASNWAGAAVLVIAQIASTAATARLVAPAEFGLYAAAQATAGVFGFLCMKAVGQGLQRRESLGTRTVGTALLVSLSSSLVVCALLMLGAAPIAAAWGLPDATWTVRVFALALLFQSAAVVPVALLRRELMFARAAAIETSALAGGMALGVGCAAVFHSAVALAAGQAGGTAALLVASAIAAPSSLRPGFDRGDARELADFGGKVGGLGLVSYVAKSLPVWFVARAFGGFTLGVYSRAALMAELPAEYAVSSIYKVIYPLYGRVRGDAERTRALLDDALVLTTGLIWPVFAIVAGAAPILVAIVLGPQWPEAAPLLSLLAIGVCAAIPTGLLANCAEAFGWMGVVGRRQAGFALGAAIAIAVVHFAGLGVTALAAILIAVQWTVYAFTLLPFSRSGLLDARLIARQQLVHLAMACASGAIAFGCTELTEGEPLPIRLSGFLAGTAVTCAAIVALRNRIPAARVLARRLPQVGSAPWPGWLRARREGGFP